jgi:hypothetical protein
MIDCFFINNYLEPYKLRSWRQTYVELIFGKVGVLNEVLPRFLLVGFIA